MSRPTAALLAPFATACGALLLFAATSAGAQQSGVLSAVAKSRPQVQQPSLEQAGSGGRRAAQNGCVKEANRRGFAVLDTREFKQFDDGWSLDLEVRDMRGRVSRGTCYVESRTGEVSLFGFGWGYDDGGDERMEFSCASTDKKYRECALPTRGQVRLVKRHSDAPCIEGRSWGQRGDVVWVDNGCRARFEVVRDASGGFGGIGGGAGGSDAQRIDCRSSDGRYRECAIGRGYFGRLEREYSRNRCRQDVTWGTRNGLIWVTDGCQAQFVRQRGNAGSVGNGSGGDDRTVECRSRDGRYQECSVGRGYVGRLVRDESGGRCRSESTWGTRDGVVWVTNGCAGRFERVRAR